MPFGPERQNRAADAMLQILAALEEGDIGEGS